MSGAELKQFPLAPMDLSLRIMTGALLTFPPGFLLLASRAPRLPGLILAGSAVMMVLLYALVWLLARPTRFEVDSAGLHIIWPLRRRRFPRENISSAQRMTWRALRESHGYGMRIGAGGLWGGFGLLKTGRETFELWISRTDELVVVRLKNGRSLLITPVQPDALVAALRPPP